MRVTIGWLLIVLSVVVFSPATFAVAQANDAQAKAAFVEGRDAFESGAFEDALRAFRKSYELSGRGELQYNIGLAADRLRLDDDAVAAFERYLAEAPNPSREQEVRERVAALKEAIARRQAAQKAVVAATDPRSLSPGSNDREIDKTRSGKRSALSIVGPIALGAVGVAGVTAMIAGIAKGGKCTMRDAGAVCIEERKTKSTAYVFGAVGGAAIAGAIVWVVVGGKKAKSKTAVGFSPQGVQITGSF